jgi:hypothetical protein
MMMVRPVYGIDGILLTGEIGSAGRKTDPLLLIHHEYHIDCPRIEPGPQREVLGLNHMTHGTAFGA